MINPCFLKQTKDEYFVRSRTEESYKIFWRDIDNNYSYSTCFKETYFADRESYFIINGSVFSFNFSFIFFSAKYYMKTRYYNEDDK